VPVVRGTGLDFLGLPGRRSADPLRGAGVDDTGASVRVVRIAPGPRTPHVHLLSAEIAYVVGGTGTAWEGDESTDVGPGDLLVVPRGVPHATVATGPAELVLVCFFPHPELADNLHELTGPLRD